LNKPLAFKTIKRQCLHCGGDFTIAAKQVGRPQMYCDSDCRNAASRRLVKGTCVVCGDIFVTTNTRTQACGRSCGAALAHRSRTANAMARRTRTCLTCHATFVMRSPSGRARRGETIEGQFCSRPCAARWVTRRPAVQLDLLAAVADPAARAGGGCTPPCPPPASLPGAQDGASAP
jgi:hypothetical protein